MNTQARLNAMERAVLDASRSVQQVGVELYEDLSQLSVNRALAPDDLSRSRTWVSFPPLG